MNCENCVSSNQNCNTRSEGLWNKLKNIVVSLFKKKPHCSIKTPVVETPASVTLLVSDATKTFQEEKTDINIIQTSVIQNFTNTLGPKAARKVMSYVANMDPVRKEEMLSQENIQNGKAIKELAKAIADPAIIAKANYFLTKIN